MGQGYERRLNGQKAKSDKLRPHVAIRSGNYVLLGYHTERFKFPQKFRLFDVVNDPEQKRDLSSKQRSRLETMKSQMEKMYRSVNDDRMRSARAIEK